MNAAPLLTLALAGQLLSVAGMLPPPSSQSLRDELDAQPAQSKGQQVQFDTSRFDSLTALSLRSFLDTAIEQGIPIGPLINRALEGSARKVRGADIMKVVRAHAAALAQAMEVLGPTAPVAELDAGASALRAGIDRKALAAIRAARPVGSVTIPLMVLTDIQQRGVPAAIARDAVTTISRMPASDEALWGLRAAVAKNSVRGPGMAVDALNRYVKGTVSGSIPTSVPAAPDRKPIRPPSP